MYRQLICFCALSCSFTVFAWGDSDFDGVPDKKDACADTAIDTVVLANGCELTLTKAIVSTIYFDFGQHQVLRSQIPSIEATQQFIKDNNIDLVHLVGHTDNVGSELDNTVLSVKRAQAVKDILVEQFAIDANVIEVGGIGSLAPKSTNSTALGRQKNRRVEFNIE